MKIKEKHIERLAKGKKSGASIGSRSVPHHLYAYEKKKFELAIKYRFLTTSDRQRPNLRNLWEKYCAAKDWPFLILQKNADGTAIVFVDGIENEFEDPQSAKKYVKDQL